MWYHEACRVMTGGDPEGWNFLSHPHTDNELYFFLAIKFSIFHFFFNKSPKVSRIR